MKEARNIMFPNGKCGCATERVEYTDYIEFCPLHAAAPDMYEALMWAMKHVENVFALANRNDRETEELNKARAALAKAEGK